MISSLVGIGGGSLTVPFLAWCNISIRNAVATSSACGFPVAVAGTLGFIFNGLNVPHLPAWSVGYVYLPAFLAIVPTSLLFAPVGAKLAHTLSTVMVKRFSAVFLAIVGIKMLYG
ncbi:MAG: sulfite exporter TauE/SafE family protein [Thiotrichaceae bacterium]